MHICLLGVIAIGVLLYTLCKPKIVKPDSIWMMNYSKITTEIAFIVKNNFQDINVSYHFQTLFNWIKDLLIWERQIK